METKYFSHHHPLVFHHLPQPSQHHCSGCNYPATGDVYACWTCSYFLHSQCFRATRSIHHPSHPLHPLTLVPFPTYPSSSFFCNSCSLVGDAFSYTCSACDFDIHIHCALMPNPNPTPNLSSSPIPLQNHILNPSYPPQNAITIPNHPSPNPKPHATPQNPQPEPVLTKHFSHPHALKQNEIEAENTTLCSACELQLSNSSSYCCTEPHCFFALHKACFDMPRELRHKSHPLHSLTLLPASPYSTGSFTCDACRKSGKAYVYTCTTCSYDLHVSCIRWPETVTRPDHDHALSLYYKSRVAGGEVFVCSVCREAAEERAWVYSCKECGFGSHLECVNSEMKKKEEDNACGSIEDELVKLQIQKMELDFQMQMAKQHAEFMTSIANSWKSFF